MIQSYFLKNKLCKSIMYPFASKKYILSQFPYPSGELHLGHARVYYIGDTLSRYYKLQGNDVIYPIGFDSFGLPAENAAIIHGKDPKVWTENNIKQMKEQLNSLNIQFNWQRQFATHTPTYYKWTQQIFLKLFKKGLAYKAVSEVNWDPVDQTVLANQQVDNQGKSWRSGALVEKKQLSQWFLGITQYAHELQSSLSNLEWIQRVKSMQAGWIGFQKGYQVELKIIEMKQEWCSVDPGQCKNTLNVFIKDLNNLSNLCKIRLNVEDKNAKNRTSSDQVLLGYVKSPISNLSIPVIRGKEQNGIKYELFVAVQNQEKGKLVDSIEGKPTTVMRIKDWSISRQRFWGTPIPIIYCSDCGIVAVPEDQLPVILPEWKNQGNPLLSDHFKNCTCPNCGKTAKRQTDTMDTFVDSSWYYLRFLDSKNQKSLCQKQLADKWLPVDIYIGGIEHAIMHLLYARFIMRTLSDIGISDVKEPFKQLIVQGLVKGKAFKVKKTGKYLKPEEVSKYHQNDIEETYEKMSKSKFNGLNPQTLVQKFGPDSLRIAIFFASPPQHDVDFSEQLLVSAEKFLNKIGQMRKTQTIKSEFHSWNQVKQKIKQFSTSNNQSSIRIKKVLVKLEESMQKRFMHVYVANTMELFNEIKSINNTGEWQQFIFNYVFLPVLSVIAPKTVSQFRNDSMRQTSISYEWPQSSFFGNQKEYTIMKNNKMIKSGSIEYENNSITEQQIRSKLNLDKDCLVKNNKKSIVIIIK